MTYYEILEIAPNASEEVIHMAYKALAKKYHPDVFQGPFEEAETKMKQINMAYSVLSDKEKRERYDAYLRDQQTAAGTKTTEDKEETSSGNQRQKLRIAPMVITLLLVAVVALSLVCLFGRSPDIEEVKDSVVMIEVYDNDDELIGSGSGFCAYEPNWIATNYHVIEGAKSIKIITDSQRELYAKKVLFFNGTADLAVLEIDGELSPLEIGKNAKTSIKDTVTAIGSPRGELNTVSEGIISNADNKQTLRITAPISHGSSGGVLLNEKNQVIGITSAGYDEAQNLNFAISISVLDELCFQYKKGSGVNIDTDNITMFARSWDSFENPLPLNSVCYTVPTLDVFYKLTNRQKRFEHLLEVEEFKSGSPSWKSIYNSLDESNQKIVLDLFKELNRYQFDCENIETDIAYWDETDFLLSLGVVESYEYAIIVTDFSTMDGWDSHFDRVHDYPLNTAECCLVLYLVGGYDWEDIHSDNKEDIFDYFSEKYDNGELETIEELGTVLAWLGYDVEYENDGSLTAYW